MIKKLVQCFLKFRPLTKYNAYNDATGSTKDVLEKFKKEISKCIGK